MENPAKVTPIGERVLLNPIEEKQTIGNLSIPETEKGKKPRKAKVIALGTGVNKKGEKVSFRVKVGDIVIYKQYSGEEITVDSTDYVIINEDDIVALVN